MKSRPSAVPGTVNDFGFAELEIGQVYGRWIISIVGPFLTERVMEIGCGIGSMVQQYVHTPFILATDINPAYIQLVKKRFDGYQNIIAMPLDITAMTAQQKRVVLNHKVTSVLAVNVLEHIENDRLALSTIRQVLPRSGRLILFVPAHQWLFGTLDEEFGHFRRYSVRELKEKLNAAGFTVSMLRYFNITGILWWYMVGKILKKRNLPTHTGTWLYLLVPLLQMVEKSLPPPIGQSLIVVAEVRG